MPGRGLKRVRSTSEVFPKRLHRSKLLLDGHVFEGEVERHGLMYTSAPNRFKSLWLTVTLTSGFGAQRKIRPVQRLLGTPCADPTA